MYIYLYIVIMRLWSVIPFSISLTFVLESVFFVFFFTKLLTLGVLFSTELGAVLVFN